jgi:hypothetical protein
MQGYLLAGASIGMQFTDITVWLAISMTLSVFQISKVDEESEKPSVFLGCVSIVSNLSDSGSTLTFYLLSHPQRFKCKISPRSKSAEELILQSS